ncbi:MAG: YggN family protein [Alkalimonas sp.]|nr:YggN family protein [Alkalimonas sp.]
MSSMIISTALALSMAGTTINQQQCNFQLQHDLTMTPQQLTVSSGSTELWRIDQDGQLWLQQQPQQTSPAHREQLQQYRDGVYQQGQTTVRIVIEAMDLAYSAVDQVLTELTGRPLAQHKAMQSAMQKVDDARSRIISEQGDSLVIRGSQLDALGDAFGPEFEAAIEEVVQSSMSSIFWQLGKAFFSGEGSFEQRMEAFGERMEKFGEELEASMDLQAAALEQQGDALCDQIQQLTVLEQDLISELPKLAPYALFQQNNQAMQRR